MQLFCMNSHSHCLLFPAEQRNHSHKKIEKKVVVVRTAVGVLFLWCSFVWYLVLCCLLLIL
jgi:hypothetical protein